MNGAGSRRKGNGAMLAVVRWLQANGHPHCERRSAGQTGDDIIGVPGLSIEVKNQARLALADWVDQACEQADGRPAVVIHKRRGRTDVGEWYATLPVADFFRLVR